MKSEPLIARLDWGSVEDAIQSELKGGVRNRPPSTLFRWWARRPYELVGALLDAGQELSTEPLAVSDPFSGGCTVALEASLRGYRAHAQDLNPWPLMGMDVALGGESAEAIRAEGTRMLSYLRTNCTDYRAHCSSHEHSEVLVAFWVRKLNCPQCLSSCYSYPYGLVSLASRASGESFGYFGCIECGDVSKLSVEENAGPCRTCQRNLYPAKSSLMRNREQLCPHCSVRFNAFDYQDHGWKLSLVQRKCLRSDGSHEVHFDYPSRDDLPHVCDYEIPDALAQPIQVGIETNILRRAGFQTWGDLYPPRQMRVLLRAVEYARQIDDRAVRRHVLLAICGAAETPGFLVRWDRYYPKAFLATDNHRFAPVGVAAELNPLATQGRGTLVRRMELARMAVEWNKGSGHAQKRTHGSIAFNVGSSIRQPIDSDTIDLVLTDPPYFGDIQYSELSTPLLIWAETVGLLESGEKVDPFEEVVINRLLQLDGNHYRQTLETIFRECVRTMKHGARLVMTFNNRDLRAWYALGLALRKAGLWIYALAPVVSESKNDHSKKAQRAFTRDLVIECCLDRCDLAYTRETDDSSEASELLAAGRMLASRTWSSIEEARHVFYSFLDHDPRWISPRSDASRGSRAA